MNQTEEEIGEQILAGIRHEPLRPPDREEGLVFKSKVWELSVSELFEPREGWTTSVKVTVTEKRGKRTVHVSAEDGYVDVVKDKLVAAAIARLK